MSAIASVRREALIAELDGRFADAEALLQAELGQSSREAPLLLQLGRLHYAWAEGAPGSHEEIAERLLARAAELDLHDATAPLYLGHVRLRRGLHGAAGEAYRETIRRDPHCAPAHEALAVLSARSMKRQTRIAWAAAIALLLSSAALRVHQFVQGTDSSPAASAVSESPERRAKNEVAPARRPTER
jgi:tetratricopeptide (TPR) repeat protein